MDGKRLVGGDRSNPTAIAADARWRVVGDLSANLAFIDAVADYELTEIPTSSESGSQVVWKAMGIRPIASDVVSQSATARFQPSDPRKSLLLAVWQLKGVPIAIRVQPLALRPDGTSTVGDFEATLDAASIAGSPVFLLLEDGNLVARRSAGDSATIDKLAALLALGCDAEVAEAVRQAGRQPVSAPHERSLLHLAAQAGAVESLGALLALLPDPLLLDTSGDTALHLAARCARLEIVDRLLAAKFPCDATNGADQTALHVAAIGAHPQICEKLIEAGASPTALAKDKNSPLLCALYSNCVPAIKLMVARGAVFNFSERGANRVLVLKAGQGQRELVQLLLPYATHLNTTWHGQTALMAAASEGHLEILDDLLKAKADPNFLTLGAGTPLIAAASRGRVESIRRLIAGGAAPDKANLDGRTPLQAACYAGSAESVSVLLAAGSSVERAGLNGATPLSLALESGSRPTVELLIAAKARVDPSATDFSDALSRALATDSDAYLAAALKAGLSTNFRTSAGWSTLQIATVAKADRCIALLRAAGADASENNSTTALVTPSSQLEKRPSVVAICPPEDPRDPNESDLESKTVVVEAIINQEGKPVLARATCEDCRLAASATRTVLRSVFAPAIKGGKQVATQVRIPVRFLSRDELVFSSDTLDVRPAGITQIAPVYPFDLKRKGITGDATVDFLVGPDGTVRDVTVVSASHKELGACVVAAVRQWKLKPGVRDGKPVTTRMRQRFTFGLADSE